MSERRGAFLSQEGQLLDKKSLRLVVVKNADWNELGKGCAAFANASGGHLLIGIKDDQSDPPAGQHIPNDLADLIPCKVAECRVNVLVLPEAVMAANNGEYIDLRIPRSVAVVSTTDGRYFLRVADQSKPVVGDAQRQALSPTVAWLKNRTIFPACDKAMRQVDRKVMQ